MEITSKIKFEVISVIESATIAGKLGISNTNTKFSGRTFRV